MEPIQVPVDPESEITGKISPEAALRELRPTPSPERVGKLRRALGERRLSFAEWVELLPPGRAAGDDGAGGRVAIEDCSAALWIDDEELIRVADARRRELHPDDIVTYVIDRNINYTNVCTSICNFCAFYRSPGEDGGYVLEYEDIYRKVEETLELGGSGILMQGGLHPDLPLEWYTELLRQLKERYGIHLHCFSPTEILGLQEVSGLSARDVLLALKEAGLDSMPGGGGEILVDDVRRKRRSKVNSREWLEIMETAQEVGLPTTATMMFGHGESLEHRLQHLESIRELQDRAGGFVSFILWNFQPDNTPLGRVISKRVEEAEFLRWLAISRIYLDNIPNLQVSWLTQGLEVGMQGLRSGANDFGSTMIEENVIRPAGARHEATDEVLRQTIAAAGFTPVKRNAAYVRLDSPQPDSSQPDSSQLDSSQLGPRRPGPARRWPSKT